MCHGFFVPAADARRLPELVSAIPAERQPEVRVLAERAGWFFLLPRGEMPAVGAHGLARRDGDPGLFHPAELTPVPAPTAGALREAGVGPGECLIGYVAEAQLAWVRVPPGALGDLAGLIGARPPERPLTAAAVTPPPPPALGDFPEFAPLPPPPAGEWLAQARREIGAPERKRRGLLDRLLGRGATPPLPEDWEAARRAARGSRARGEAAAGGAAAAGGERVRELAPAPFRRLREFLDRILRGPAGGTAARDGSGGGGGFVGRMSAALRAALRDRHAAMMDRLLGAFARGDLDLALRHSIPINDDFVDDLRGPRRLATNWRLPDNLVDFTLGLLNRRAGAVIPTAGLEGQVMSLVAAYHRAAQAMEARGEARKAAFVYAHLLHDFQRAADVLARHGYAREAAAVYLEKLGNRRAAAEALLAGGHVDDAAGLWLEQQEFAAAASVYERAGFPEEARGCYVRQAEHLAAAGLRMDAAGVWRERLGDAERALALYREELEKGRAERRGEAGALVLELEHAGGGDVAAAWAAVLGRVRTAATARAAARADAGALVELHRRVREWRPERKLPEGLDEAMRRAARGDLLELVAAANTAGGAQGAALGELRRILEVEQDRPALRDLVRALGRRGAAGATSADPDQAVRRVTESEG
ncbi:MAG: hypothetical protein HZA54_15430, partial [Planctomycetes bacterium]|nr:hypothetical protein [Planctomycetota bacterium]